MAGTVATENQQRRRLVRRWKKKNWRENLPLFSSLQAWMFQDWYVFGDFLVFFLFECKWLIRGYNGLWGVNWPVAWVDANVRYVLSRGWVKTLKVKLMQIRNKSRVRLKNIKIYCRLFNACLTLQVCARLELGWMSLLSKLECTYDEWVVIFWVGFVRFDNLNWLKQR